jgi:hypothetical protein
LEEVFGRIFRAEPRIVLFAISFPTSLLLFSITGPKQTRAPPHLGGIGADSRDVGFNPLGNRNIRPLEIFHLDVSRAGNFGG